METDVPEGDKKKKLEQTILDNFSKLTYNQQNVRVKSGVALIKHLTERKVDDENTTFELNYALKRLVRGLGSPRVNARNGFFAALVAICSVSQEISVEQVLQIVHAELQTSSSNSKSEKGEIYLGQVLACGAIIKSNLFARGADEEKAKVVEMLISAGSRRTYLPLAAVTFLNQLLETLNEEQFRKTVLPAVKKELTKPSSEYSLNNVFLLLSVKKRYPKVVNGKFLKQCIGTAELFSNDNLKVFCNILVPPAIASLKHPIYEGFANEIVTSPNLKNFLDELDHCLFKFHRNKHILATLVLKQICDNLTDFSLIPHLLTQNYLKQTLAHFKTLKLKQQDKEFQQQTHDFFNTLVNVLKKDGITTSTKFAVLERLLFYPGSLIFEKTTRSKLVQQITLLLDAEGVKKLASVYRDVVFGKKRSHESTEAWWNNDRLYAAQLLVKLLGHTAVSGENEWRIEQLQFLMELSLIRKENGAIVGSELAASLKSTFFRALDCRLPKLEDLRQLLSRLLHDLDSMITAENLDVVLRSSITTESYETWQRTVSLINKLERKEQKKKKRVRAVFHTLFLQMGLQLFNDVKLATDSLQELFKCYEKIQDKKTNATLENLEEKQPEDPYWIEVITDLFLNLLSQNLHLLRSIIACVFPHLCPYMNASAMHQILAVLDPKNEDNPLSNAYGESDDESESSEKEEEEEESESEEEDEEENETVNDKFRMAVREALGANGYQTDEESVDVDDIDEEQGQKLDEALVQAFKQFKPNLGRKSKKQTKEDEALTHFRVRVLDLIEMYLDSEPAMLLCLEIMVTLLGLLEFCVRDDHQKPLQDRVCSCLKKLTGLKKFSTTEDVDEKVLADLMRSFLDKGTRNALIMQDVGEKIAESCMFVIRCSQLVQSVETTPKKVSKRLRKVFDEIMSEALELYFKNRDCLTPYALFHNVLQSNWEGNLRLVEKLVDLAFGEEVRLFRRQQALELLKLFYGNLRFLNAHKEEFDDIHAALSEKTTSLLSGSELKINERHIIKLFNLLTVVKRCPLEQSKLDWQTIGESVRSYRSQNSLSKDGKVAYKKLCAALGIPHLVQMKNSAPKTATKVKAQENCVEEEKDLDGNKRKKKVKSKESKKLKKDAKLKRMEMSSEGLGAHISFAAAGSKIKEDNNDSGTGSLDEHEANEGNGKVSRKRKSTEEPFSKKKIKS